LLTHFSGGVQRALTGSYSPDGRWIVYKQVDDTALMMKMHPDGTDQTVIRDFGEVAPRFMDWGAG
jgi:hypothetical protein